MEGYTLARRVREMLNEPAGSSFMNGRTTYDCIRDAVQDFNKKSHFLTGTQVIPVTPGVSAYNLSPDFVAVAYKNRYNDPYIKHTVNGSDTFLFPQQREDVVLSNDQSTSPVPAGYSIIDAPALPVIAGVATSAGTMSNGECMLTDSTADFSNVYPGDFVHNTNDDGHGIVTYKTSSTQLMCALFDGGTNQWDKDDDYIVVPQARHQVILSQTPSVAASLSVFYVVRPDPVYSPYRSYNLPSDAELPICQFAAFLYKYKDREPQYGDLLYRNYEAFSRKAAAEFRRGMAGKVGFSVNLVKGNKRSNSIGPWR